MQQITLRPFGDADASAFFTWAGDPEVAQSLFWDAHPDIDYTRRFLREVVASHQWFLAICNNGTPVGAITLDRGVGRADCRAELGYVLKREVWGQGIATEAVRLALSVGFQSLGVSRIEALVDPQNLASIRVLEKSGMNREAYLSQYVTHRGQLRDRIIFSKVVSHPA